ncbi:MAG: hypothetical protein KF691_02905 [Phycisphaeraceae bacterium]|nr:hypothetical protein [Phycisphaeraceae bacterium]
MPNTSRKSARRAISDAAIAKATGHDSKHWFKVLDKFDVKKKGHKAAAEHLYDNHKIPGWWCQMVVVEYERARGLRKVNQKADGFSASISRTFECSAADIINAWSKPSLKKKWLGDDIVVHKVSPPKSIRATWNGDAKIQEPGTKSISVWLTEKKSKDGTVKCQMGLQHEKLGTAAKVAKAKEWWGDRVRRFSRIADSGSR